MPGEAQHETLRRAQKFFGTIATSLLVGLLSFAPALALAQTRQQERLQPSGRMVERLFPRKAKRPPLEPRPPHEDAQGMSASVGSGAMRKDAAPAGRTPRPRVSGAKVSAGGMMKPQRAEATSTGPRPISRVAVEEKLIALTYDDGPHPTITPQLVRLLQARNARATFFVLGDAVKASPQVVKMLVEAGMEIGNHSTTHRQLTKLSEEGIRSELATSGERIVSAAPGVRLRTMRPPYGSWNGAVMRVADEMGYRVVLWDVDTNDWRKRTSEQMTREILTQARPGSIVLMHDRYRTTLETTAAVIDILSAQGYRFVTVSELLEAGGR